ncbi:MAG: response regulator transcription factor, partial [Clostridia bacterium]
EEYQVDWAADGEEALLFASDRSYEVIVLDRMLPRLSGDQVLQQLRKFSSVPVLMLTALDSIDDRVAGLTKGADDYLCKPFAFAELLARIQVLQRRSSSAYHLDKITRGTLELFPSEGRVLVDGQPVELTPVEFRMLEVFLRRPQQVITRESLAEQVWDEPWDVQANTIEAHVKNLRKKLEPHVGNRFIATVRGMGYKLVDADG